MLFAPSLPPVCMHVHLLHAHDVRTGGVVPTVAGDLHKEHLEEVMRDALRQSRLTVEVGSYIPMVVAG